MMVLFEVERKLDFVCCACRCTSLPLHPTLTGIKLIAEKNKYV
jgi:hypothetical protein